MNNKKKFVRSFSILLTLVLLSGCQAGNQSLEGLISPKKTVPAYEPTGSPGKIMEEMIVPEQINDSGDKAISSAEQNGETGFSAGNTFGLPDADFVAGRLSYYQKKRQQWHSLAETLSMHDVAMPSEHRWNECFRLLTEVEKSYHFLTQMLEGESSLDKEANPPIDVLQKDVDFLGSDCETILSTTASLIPGQLSKYGEIAGTQADRVVQHWAQQGEYEKVVSSYEDFLVASGGKEPSLGAREEYAFALKSLGQLDKAAVEMLKVADEKGGFQGWPLRLQAAEILFAQGNFAESRQQYEKIAGLFDEMAKGRAQVENNLQLLAGEREHPQAIDLYRQALHGLLIFDGKSVPPELVSSVMRLEQSFPGSDYAVKGRMLFDQAGGSVQQYVSQEILRARQLAEMKMYPQALSILAPLADNADSEELLSLVRQNQVEIEHMQGQEYAVEQERQQKALESKWLEALGLFDHRQYDQAITAFKDLLDSDYAEQAGEKLKEAVNLAASDLRKESASLFLKSRKVQSVQQQTQLLMESRFLLLSILEKYPEADVVDKVKQNLQVAEQQIRAIDPSLLQ